MLPEILQWILHNENLGITSDLSGSSNSKIYGKERERNLDTTKPRYSEHTLPVPWPFVISRFHCILKWSLVMIRTLAIFSTPLVGVTFIRKAKLLSKRQISRTNALINSPQFIFVTFSLRNLRPLIFATPLKNFI